MDQNKQAEGHTDVTNVDNNGVANHGLCETLPKLEMPWWKYPVLLRLNGGLCCALLASATIGFDASMLNGLQAVPAWAEYLITPRAQSWAPCRTE